jgi:hypothetical protein
VYSLTADLTQETLMFSSLVKALKQSLRKLDADSEYQLITQLLKLKFFLMISSFADHHLNSNYQQQLIQLSQYLLELLSKKKNSHHGLRVYTGSDSMLNHSSLEQTQMK